MWFETSNIDSHSIEWELTMFINIRVLRLRITDWKLSLKDYNLIFIFKIILFITFIVTECLISLDITTFAFTIVVNKLFLINTFINQR